MISESPASLVEDNYMAFVEVRYFAMLRESAGVPVEIVETDAATVGDLYVQLLNKHSFKLNPRQVRASVNGDWSDLNSVIKDGDQVVFIPPVAGG